MPIHRTLVLSLALALCACAPGLMIHRVAPAHYNLGNTKRVAVLEVTGNPEAASQVLTELQRQILNEGYYQLIVATNRGVTFAVTALGGLIELNQVRREVDADVYLNANVTAYEYKETTESDEKGTRYTPRGFTRVNFQVVKADGRVIVFRDYEGHASGKVFESGGHAEQPARHYLSRATDDAVVQFITDITPRRVLEKIEFDDSFEAVKPGIKLAEDGNLAGAEASWNALLQANPNVAAAIYNIGVLAEARGDFDAARQLYQRAISLSAKSLYQDALNDMNRRLAENEALHQNI